MLIINCYGMLSSIYQYADITYVGGGFGVGIHNILEAAVWGKPVIFGPNNIKFQEAQELKATESGIEIHNQKNFNSIMDQFYSNPSRIEILGNQAANYVKNKCGATDIILTQINNP